MVEISKIQVDELLGGERAYPETFLIFKKVCLFVRMTWRSLRLKKKKNVVRL